MILYRSFLILLFLTSGWTLAIVECPYQEKELNDIETLELYYRAEKVLCNADLSGVQLLGADLSSANLIGSNLRGSELRYVELDRANLSNSDLRDADLTYASLRGTKLTGANLSGADFKFSVLTDADFRSVTFKNSECNSKYCHDNWVSFRGARDLHLIQTDIPLPPELFQLRQNYRTTGAEREADELTTLIMRNTVRWNSDSSFEYLISMIAFDWTVEWGRVPSRALSILLFLMVFFSILYLCIMRWVIRKNESDALKVIYLPGLPGEIERPFSSLFHKQQTFSRPYASENDMKLTFRQLRVLAFHAVWFSVISAFHFGWRDLNVGSWLSRILPNPFSYRSQGALRTLSGIQSLISVYLIVMWALTAFSNPWG